MDKDELIEFLKDNLWLNVKTSSHMEGCGEYRWVETHTIELMLGDEVLSSESIG